MMAKNKNILNVILFCLILNLVPTILLGLFKIPSSLYTALYALVYIIQTLVMLIFCRKKFKKITKKEALIIVICVTNSLLAILFGFLKYQSVDKNEYLFIVSLVSNVILFVVLSSKFDTDRNQLSSFIKKFLLISVISVIANFALNYKLITNLSAITNSYSVNFSSFFPNRNQFGLFMLVAVILNSILMTWNRSKKYKILQIVFIANLLLSMSRNSMFGLFVFYLAKYFIRRKNNKKKIKISTKRVFSFVASLSILGVILYVVSKNGLIQDKISELFIRADNLESGSGRFETWQNGLNLALENNIFFGVGRYLAIKLNHVMYGNNLEYFHSVYIEKLATHGILGLIWLIELMKVIWSKVKKSKVEKNIKNIILASLVSFWIFSIFETTTRFSIGYADTFFMIFFFTLPQIIANSDFGKIKSSNKHKLKIC